MLPVSPLPSPTAESSTTTLDKTGPSAKKESSDGSTINPGNLKANLKTPSITSQPFPSSPELTNAPGLRAAEAYVRPSPIATSGNVISSGFDLRNCVFSFELDAPDQASEDYPTEVFLPEYHFPKDKCDVQVTAGKWSISTDDSDGGLIQKLRWWHPKGKMKLTVKGVIQKQAGVEEEDGYYDQLSKCTLM